MVRYKLTVAYEKWNNFVEGNLKDRNTLNNTPLSAAANNRKKANEVDDNFGCFFPSLDTNDDDDEFDENRKSSDEDDEEDKEN